MAIGILAAVGLILAVTVLLVNGWTWTYEVVSILAFPYFVAALLAIILVNACTVTGWTTNLVRAVSWAALTLGIGYVWLLMVVHLGMRASHGGNPPWSNGDAAWFWLVNITYMVLSILIIYRRGQSIRVPS